MNADPKRKPYRGDHDRANLRAGTKKKHSTRRSKHLSASDPVSIGQPTPPAGNYDRTKPRRLGSAD
jgi:hypothetical protein